MDTITLIRSAIRGLLAAIDTGLIAALRTAISSGDDYASTAKPQIDWDDAAAREALIDSRARDGFAMLTLLEGGELEQDVDTAARLLATVLGQDLIDDDGVFRIARKVAVDRVISTVDPQTRHGHKTNARGFDGYKGHLATDPQPGEIDPAAVHRVVESAMSAPVLGRQRQPDQRPDRAVGAHSTRLGQLEQRIRPRGEAVAELLAKSRQLPERAHHHAHQPS